MALAPYTDYSYYNFWYGTSLTSRGFRQFTGKQNYDLFGDNNKNT